MNAPSEIIHAAGRRLPEPARRSARGLITSARIARRYRRLCRVRGTADGYWIHAYRDGVTVYRYPRVGPTIGQLHARAHDYFLQEYVPRPGDTVVDVGAGIGDELHTFARLVGDAGRVFAIEAHPATFALLERRCRLSRLANVELTQVAIADKAGQVTISDVEMGIANSILRGASASVRVPAQTLDAFVAARGIARIDFLKMNIEGAERYAIDGMAATVELTRNACICCHDFLAEDTGIAEMRTKALVRSFLEDAGFAVTGRRPDDTRPWSRDYLYGRRRA